jgi:hypothetical protein
MTRLRAFAFVVLTLAATDSAVAVALHQEPATSPAGMVARAAICMLAGYAATRSTAGVVLTPLVITGAAFVSLALSDAVILFSGAGQELPKGFAHGAAAFAFGLLGLPALAGVAGSVVALARMRPAAPRKA